jgi:hypothetical protein
MNWYKTSNYEEDLKEAQTSLETLTDRNHLNSRIKFFLKMIGTLTYMKKYVYQNAPHARQILLDFANDKVMSSFPSIKIILKDASDRALDNYKNFAEICTKAIDQLYKEINKMKDARREFSQKILPRKMKERMGK